MRNPAFGSQDEDDAIGLAELAAMGRTVEDVRALVLTHGHDDHYGFAERLRAEHGVPVSIHALDAPLARGEAKNPSAGMGERRLGSLLHYMLWLIRHGAMRPKPLQEIGTFEPGTTLDVPRAASHCHARPHPRQRGLPYVRARRPVRG